MGLITTLFGIFTRGGILGLARKGFEFITSPAGVAVIMVFVVMYARYDAKKDARALCRTDALAAELAEERRQHEATRAVAEATEKQADKTAVQNTELNMMVRSYEDKLKGKPGCNIIDDPAERLRKLQ